jgi:hypothetical protein
MMTIETDIEELLACIRSDELKVGLAGWLFCWQLLKCLCRIRMAVVM